MVSVDGKIDDLGLSMRRGERTEKRLEMKGFEHGWRKGRKAVISTAWAPQSNRKD